MTPEKKRIKELEEEVFNLTIDRDRWVERFWYMRDLHDRAQGERRPDEKVPEPGCKVFYTDAEGRPTVGVLDSVLRGCGGVWRGEEIAKIWLGESCRYDIITFNRVRRV